MHVSGVRWLDAWLCSICADIYMIRIELGGRVSWLRRPPVRPSVREADGGQQRILAPCLLPGSAFASFTISSLWRAESRSHHSPPLHSLQQQPRY